MFLSPLFAFGSLTLYLFDFVGFPTYAYAKTLMPKRVGVVGSRTAAS